MDEPNHPNMTEELPPEDKDEPMDIVERLRRYGWDDTDRASITVGDWMREAAEEIERLRAEIERLREEVHPARVKAEMERLRGRADPP